MLSLHELIPGKFAYMQTCLFFCFAASDVEFFEEKREQVVNGRSPVLCKKSARIFLRSFFFCPAYFRKAS